MSIEHIGGHRSRVGGFTLVEMMVSIAVVSIILVTMAGMLNEANQGVSALDRRLDSASLCRVALDRIDYDISSMVVPSLSTELTGIKNPINDELGFYSDVRTTVADSRFAKLEYSIGTAQSSIAVQTIPALIRINSSVSWSADPLTTATSSTGDCLGAGIFRFEIAFLSKNGQITITAPTDPKQLRAVIVAIAALDFKTYKLMTNAEITSLAGKFGKANAGQTPASVWMSVDYSGLPAPVQQNVYFYERYFYVR